ncbi:hypothetical protein E3N88_45933 [Mikania micrantha]|uniref:Uncharacterized protein n=1 Tax=Mikania micrantha TaxID=192012 RepID=A0A5N6L7V1_9ASTR|nr:hypothetical protein E3N88_45933 [Mikania micrantha]
MVLEKRPPLMNVKKMNLFMVSQWRRWSLKTKQEGDKEENLQGRKVSISRCPSGLVALGMLDHNQVILSVRPSEVVSVNRL